MEREIILDTETTGLSPKEGHRIIEIGAVELVNRLPTGNNFHVYINPERDVPLDAQRIHGITDEFLRDKPKFNEIVEDFVEFIGESKIVIHNADFDIRFLNAELFYVKKPEISRDRVFCSLIHARKKFPGAQNSLDALCRRFNVDNSNREKHGALLDSELLAEVYLELMGGKQNVIELAEKEKKQKKTISENNNVTYNADFKYRNFDIVSEEEKESHKKSISTIKNSLWENYN